MTGLSVVVPVYQSQNTLRVLHQTLIATLETLQRQFEIILVDDGSRDQSWSIIEEIGRLDTRVRGIRLSRNYGQHNALLCGMRAARFDVIVTLDDDLQNPPHEIPKLLQKLEEGYDVVYGTPDRERHGLLRNLASRLTKLALQETMGAETARSVSAFRAFRSELRTAIDGYHGPYISIDVLLTWATTRFASVTVGHQARAAGQSGYTLRKLITHAVNMMTGFTTLPLHLASLIGLLCTAFGAVILGYVTIRYVSGTSTVPGFTFLASVIAIFSGAQLFALGIIGAYLARMHFRTMGRPSYSVRDKLNDSPKITTDNTSG